MGTRAARSTASRCEEFARRVCPEFLDCPDCPKVLEDFPMSGGSDSTLTTASEGTTPTPAEVGDPTSSGASAGSTAMSAFLESVRATVRDEIRRYVPPPATATTNLHPPEPLGSVGTDPGAGVPPSAATAVAGPSGAGTGKYTSWAGTHAA